MFYTLFSDLPVFSISATVCRSAGATGQDGRTEAADPRARTVQDGCRAHLTVQGGNQEPVSCLDRHPRRTRGLRLRRAVPASPAIGQQASQLHGQTK